MLQSFSTNLIVSTWCLLIETPLKLLPWGEITEELYSSVLVRGMRIDRKIITLGWEKEQKKKKISHIKYCEFIIFANFFFFFFFNLNSNFNFFFFFFFFFPFPKRKKKEPNTIGIDKKTEVKNGRMQKKKKKKKKKQHQDRRKYVLAC